VLRPPVISGQSPRGRPSTKLIFWPGSNASESISTRRIWPAEFSCTGTYTFTIKVTDANKTTATKSLTITIKS
jgi:hypothetical protein